MTNGNTETVAPFSSVSTIRPQRTTEHLGVFRTQHRAAAVLGDIQKHIEVRHGVIEAVAAEAADKHKSLVAELTAPP